MDKNNTERQQMKQDGLIISYYLSRCNQKALDVLGYKNYNAAFTGIGELLGENPNNIKNMRDEFDPYFNNGRRGWYQRELRPSRKKVFDYFSNYSDEDLGEVVKRIIGKYDKNNATDSSCNKMDSAIDRSVLNDILKKYKQDFISFRWENEKFKWEAVKTFQDNWDINASDFPEMLSRSLSQTGSLLASTNFFPAGMIIEFAQDDPRTVRDMFISLFDEHNDVSDRIAEFKKKSFELLGKYGNGTEKNYQNENAITTYLWLRYPDKYYIYKFKEVKKVANVLCSGYQFKKGAYSDNLGNFFALYNEICEYISTDEEITGLLNDKLAGKDGETCYSDPEYRTLTIDVGFYISRFYPQKETTNEWFPADYSPDISTDTWLDLLENPEVFTNESLEIMKRLSDIGGQATCKQLAAKYGENTNFYSSGSVALARRVANKTGCPLLENDTENSKWWPILYLGKYADQKDEGVYIWKLRDELSEALNRYDLSDIKLYSDGTNTKDSGQNYWWLNASPKIWSFAEINVGETEFYTLYNQNGNKRHIFQNFLDVKAGDMVIGYESNPVKQIVALCQITAAQDGEKIVFKKIESLEEPIDFSTLKDAPELENMEFFANPNGSLFHLTKDEYEFIMDLIREANPIIKGQVNDKYSKKDFLDEVFMSEVQYDRMVAVLKHKKNIILQGAPGVGKTFAARRLAYSMMGEKDEDRIKFVQFHQNYTYEDFVMGYKPTEEGGFQLKRGIFYQFCRKAENQPDKDFFFLIDEINRGNMSKIFGELLMLIENDYRGKEKANLSYNDEPFSVPENLYIIGMMNTADRSLAMIDYALRRRFSFFSIEPAFDSEGFKNYQTDLNNETFNRLIDKVKELNQKIASDASLGKGFCIGHSYFSNWKKEECTDEKMQETVDYEIIPMLEEYWFDDNTELQYWENALHGVFQ